MSVEAAIQMRAESTGQFAFDTPLGRCALRWGGLGVTGVMLPPTRASAREGRSARSELPAQVREAIDGIIALLRGERRDLRDVVLDERGIDGFRRRVYAATREIAPGATASYGEIARAIGAPDDARGVGAALGANPFPIVVPCHRVLAADGGLRGFSAPGGVRTKRRMLEIEGAPGFAQRALFA